MHATTDARVPRAVDTCESSNLRSHSRSTTSVATKIDLASRVSRASRPTLEESRRQRTAPGGLNFQLRAAARPRRAGPSRRVARAVREYLLIRAGVEDYPENNLSSIDSRFLLLTLFLLLSDRALDPFVPLVPPRLHLRPLRGVVAAALALRRRRLLDEILPRGRRPAAAAAARAAFGFALFPPPLSIAITGSTSFALDA